MVHCEVDVWRRATHQEVDQPDLSGVDKTLNFVEREQE